MENIIRAQYIYDIIEEILRKRLNIYDFQGVIFVF